LTTQVGSLTFAGPVGLAAGLDKNGTLARFWENLGFGFVELGTVTALEQPGNPKPRLFRFPDERALVNRMGFNNGGATGLARRLAALTSVERRSPRGVNLGKSKVTALADAASDYAQSTQQVAQFADYLVINVSSPNTPGLRSLQDSAALTEILTATRENAQGKPVFVKLAPDLTDSALRDAADVAQRGEAAGIIATNTTIERFGLPDVGPGGLSGRPLHPRSVDAVGVLTAHTDLPVIGVGGIRSTDDVLNMLCAGACAVQLYSALVFEGPGLVHRINRQLLAAMNRAQIDSFTSFQQALATGELKKAGLLE
jgi:dihydroorotate dehydrogenase